MSKLVITLLGDPTEEPPRMTNASAKKISAHLKACKRKLEPLVEAERPNIEKRIRDEIERLHSHLIRSIPDLVDEELRATLVESLTHTVSFTGPGARGGYRVGDFNFFEDLGLDGDVVLPSSLPHLPVLKSYLEGLSCGGSEDPEPILLPD